MTPKSLIGYAFNAFYILIIAFFILRSISLIRRDDRYREKIRETKSRVRNMGLLVLDPGSNRAIQKGDFIHLKNGLSFGRGEENSIVLSDPFISNQHTRFFVHNGRYVIEDLNSKNGTVLNRDRLLKKTYLRPDDIITIGTAMFRVMNK